MSEAAYFFRELLHLLVAKDALTEGDVVTVAHLQTATWSALRLESQGDLTLIRKLGKAFSLQEKDPRRITTLQPPNVKLCALPTPETRITAQVSHFLDRNFWSDWD